MSAHSEIVVEEFYDLCNKAYSDWRILKVLFDDNPNRTRLELTIPGSVIQRFRELLQESFLLQIAKLHDPAIMQGQAILGIEYVVRFGGWDETIDLKLRALQTELNELAKKIRPARHKILSHNDLETILNHSLLGAFLEKEDENYFVTLQKFFNYVHDDVIGGPKQFGQEASNDAKAFLMVFETLSTQT